MHVCRVPFDLEKGEGGQSQAGKKNEIHIFILANLGSVLMYFCLLLKVATMWRVRLLILKLF